VSAVAAFAAFPTAVVAVWVLLRSPLATRLVANPSADRWHEKPTPLLGGVGIFAGLSAGLWVAVATGTIDAGRGILGIYGGIALLFVAGLVDDVHALPPLAKLGLQFAAAAIVLATGTNVQLIHQPVVAGALALVWLVGMTNAFNLLDNMDGLAATLAAIAFAFFAIDAVTIHPNHVVLALATAGALACAGFLPFNLRPGGKALVFMGDSGSQLLGFGLAALGLSSSWKVAGTTVATLLLPVLVLAVPILDTTLVTILRLLEGRPVYQGGRDHSSHRLVRFGLSETNAVLLLACISVALGGTSLAYNVLDDQKLAVVGVLVTFVLLVQFASFLADVERRSPTGESPSLLETFAVHWRRLVEVVVDFALIVGAFAAAYLLRFGWPGTDSQRHLAEVALPIVIATRYLAFIPFGLYRSVWRYAAARDLASIVTAVAVSEVVAAAYMALTQTLGDFYRSFFLIDALVCAAAVVASRFAGRTVVRAVEAHRAAPEARRALVVGAGRSGRSLAREFAETGAERIVGFVDDNPRLRRRRLQGVPVLGGTHELDRILERSEIDIVYVTIPDAPLDRLTNVLVECERRDVACRFVRRELDLDPRVVLGRTSS
jgi:UDP-GlcNAc:undecaprenyl-phosphate GlcNAc-1-phosphate transferase